MEPIVWSGKFSVGVKKLDEQHKQLVSMINKLIQSPDASTLSETISDTLTAMIQYAREHFRLEETLMARYRFPHLEQHKKLHATFFKKVAELSLATIKNDNVVPQELLGYLYHWLQTHILEEDMLYKPLLEGKAIDD